MRKLSIVAKTSEKFWLDLPAITPQADWYISKIYDVVVTTDTGFTAPGQFSSPSTHLLDYSISTDNVAVTTTTSTTITITATNGYAPVALSLPDASWSVSTKRTLTVTVTNIDVAGVVALTTLKDKNGLTTTIAPATWSTTAKLSIADGSGAESSVKFEEIVRVTSYTVVRDTVTITATAKADTGDKKATITLGNPS